VEGPDRFKGRAPDKPVIRLGQTFRRLSQDSHLVEDPADIEGSPVVDHHPVRGDANPATRPDQEPGLFLELAHEGGLRRLIRFDSPSRQGEPESLSGISDFDECDPPAAARDPEDRGPIRPTDTGLGQSELRIPHQSLP
jgi:hypothetical protein